MARVGVLDDNGDIVVLLTLAFEDEHTVVGHTSATEALDDPAFMASDVLVVDWAMPDMNGAEFMRWLPPHPRRPLVVVFTAGGDWPELRESGADAVVEKGYSISDTLAPVLGRLLGRLP